MMWSQLKSRIESGFADPVRGRVEVWSTRYRRAHDEAGEGWITLDCQRLFSAGTLAFYQGYYGRVAEFVGDGLGRAAAHALVEQDMAARLTLPQWSFTRSLFDYLNLSIDAILTSDNPLIRAFGMLDRRLGKRRLKALDVSGDLPLVQEFHEIRCRLEGLSPADLPRPVAGVSAVVRKAGQGIDP